MPKAVEITGQLGGKLRKWTLPVAGVTEQADYLPRTWAKLEIDRLVADGAEKNKARIIELSKAMYVMSPFTSLLVLENEEMYAQYHVDRGRKDHWAMYACPEKIPVVNEPLVGPVNRSGKAEAQGSTVDEVLSTVLVRIPPAFLGRPGARRFNGVLTLSVVAPTSSSPYWDVDNVYDGVPELVLYTTAGDVAGFGKVYQVTGTDGRVMGKVNLPETNTKLRTQQKLAELVDQYNRLNEEQRFEEAMVVAKRAQELAPHEMVTRVMVTKQSILAKVEREKQIRENKSDSIANSFMDVDVASDPGTGEPYVFPDTQNWKAIAGRRAKRAMLLNRHHRSEKEIEIEKKLLIPVNYSCRNRPLNEVLNQLAKLVNVNIRLDDQGLREEGLSPDAPVTLELASDIMLKSYLNLILEKHHLCYIIENGMLNITSETKTGDNAYQQAYPMGDRMMPISDFVGGANEAGFNMAFCDGAVRSMNYNIDPTLHILLGHRADGQPTDLVWPFPYPDDPPIVYPDAEVWRELTARRKEIYGWTNVYPVADLVLPISRPRLLITETMAFHDRRTEDIPILICPTRRKTIRYSSTNLAWYTPAEWNIIEALKQPTQIEFVETPLKDVIEYLKDLHHVEIQLDSPALKEEGIDEYCAGHEESPGHLAPLGAETDAG